MQRLGQTLEKNALPDSRLVKFSKKSHSRKWHFAHLSLFPCRLVAFISVLESNYIVLAQVAPRLNFYEEQRHLSHVFESMLGSDRDIGGFIFGQKLHLITSRHARSARYHHPVLRPVMMHLQRERFAHLDHDALHLKARARVDTLV